jgi:hypothetical protein
MFITNLTRSLLLIPLVVTAVLVAAPAAQADCKFQGDAKAGSVDCITWAAEKTQGSDQTSGSEQTGGSGDTAQAGQVDVAGTGSQGTGSSSTPTCRDSQGRVVPCTTVSDSGDPCYFSGSIDLAPGGSGGGAVYLCQPPAPPGEDDPSDDPPITGAPPAAASVDPVVVVWRAIASLNLRAVDMQIAPKPLSMDGDSMGLVGLPVWLWVDETTTTWGPVTASASDGPVSVSVTARVERVEFDMGDGTVITCHWPGTTFDPDVYSVDTQSPDCGHVYKQVSRDPAGVYTVTATSYWVADWSSGADAGTIPFDFTTSEQIRIGEMQVLRTGGAS